MKKVIKKEEAKYYCDVTGKELVCPESSMNLCFLSKTTLPREEDYYEEEWLEFDLCGEVAFEIVKFLRRKYPDLECFKKFKKYKQVLKAMHDVF
jgi:hypothetical protein